MKYLILAIIFTISTVTIGQDKPLSKEAIIDRSVLPNLQRAGYQTAISG